MLFVGLVCSSESSDRGASNCIATTSSNLFLRKEALAEALRTVNVNLFVTVF